MSSPARLCLLLVFSAFLLTGCGFHLIQPQPNATDLVVNVINNGAPLVSRSLKDELRLRNTRTQEQSPDITITVRNEQVDNRLIAIDSNNRAAEYQLEHSIQVSAQQGVIRSDWQTLTATRDYTYDEANVLGKSQERLLIRQTLREELAQRIIERFLWPVSTEVLASKRSKPVSIYN